VEQAYQSLKQSMIEFGAKMGPEVVR
jgi:hypothetical protein